MAFRVDQVRPLATRPDPVEADGAQDAPQLRIQVAVVESHLFADAACEYLADGRRWCE